MKLKPVVASLVLVGLMTPAFAKTSAIAQQAVIDQNAAVSPVCSDGWFNRISVGGFGSVVGVWGNHDQPGMFTTSSSGSDLFINNANVLVNANLSSWTKATLNLAYKDAPSYSYQGGVYSKDNAHHYLDVDEAYVTVANLAKTPFYAKVGKMFVPFGDYNDTYAPVQIKSPAQSLAQIDAPAAVVGVTTDFGFYANLFGFKGNTEPQNSTAHNIRNWGGKVGFYNDMSEFKIPNAHINLNVSYVHNALDSDDMGSALSSVVGDGTHVDAVGAVSVHGDLSYQAFDLTANWVGLVKNALDAVDGNSSSSNSKLWGADVYATYAFKTLNHDSHLGAGVQWTGNGQWIADSSNGESASSNAKTLASTLPKWRVLGDYKVNLFKNTDMDFIVSHGKSYDGILGDTSSQTRTSTAGLARLMIQF